MEWLLSLASVLLVSAVSFIGLLTLALDEARRRHLSVPLVSLAVGSLLGDAFIHLLPEAFESGSVDALGTSLLVLAGMLSFFMLEKVIRHRHAAPQGESTPSRAGHAKVWMINVIGDSIHNFIDGALIGASYLASPALGVSTTLAVICHELPQELGDFGVLVHSGLSVRRAASLNLASASAAMLGAIATLIAGQTAGRLVSDVLLPVTAGGFVYIAGANLIPELQRDASLRDLLLQVTFISIGITAMAALTLLD
jgi:zinc and cadmium transporter